MNERVVITGVGAVTPLGLSAPTSLDAVFAGQSGIARIEGFDTSDMAVTIGGEVRGFDPASVVSRADMQRLDPHALYAIAAAQEAIEQAFPGWGGEDPLVADPTRLGIAVGSSSGAATLVQEATRTLDAQGPARVRPGVVVYGGTDSAATVLSVRYGALGASHGISATCASGAMALGEALRTLRHGYADAMIVTSGDHCANPVNMAANANIRALTRDFATEPERASRPFDAARSGFVMSSGGAALVCETERSALARGANILATVEGYGASSDAHHATAPHPDGEGAARAMRLALADAGVPASAVHHINAHATSTPLGDRSEALALSAVFGAEVPPVTATKSVSGHMIGVSGLFEVLVCVETLCRGLIPPTLNLETLDVALDVVSGSSRPFEGNLVLTNSLGFGGHNASLLIGAA